MLVRMPAPVTLLSLLAVLACSDGSEDSEAPEEVQAPDFVISTPEPEPDISCKNACQRPPKCEEDLGTEEDCFANCENNADPQKYACCIQTASGCSEVERCVKLGILNCKEDVDPWMPLAPFDKCECGEPDNPTPQYQECVAQGADTPCVTEDGAGLCLKPANYSDAPFCAIECTPGTNPCPDPYKCESTPKKNYCKKPFG